MGIFDITQEEEASTGIFGDQVEKPKVTNVPSAKHISAQAAVVSSEDPLSAYQEIQLRGDDQAEEPATKTLEDKRRMEEGFTRESAIDMLGDTEIPEDVRSNIGKYLATPEARKSSSLLLMEDFISKPSEFETEAKAEARLDLSTMVSDMEARQRLMQSAMNGEELNTNPGIWNTLGDLAELAAPFAEQVFTYDYIDKLRAGDKEAIDEFRFLLGSKKAELRDYVASMSYNEKTQFGELLKQVISESSGLVFTNDNDLMQKDSFLSIMESGYYEGGLEFIDNAVSLMEWSGILAPVARAASAKLLLPAKAIRATTAISKIANRYRRTKVAPASVARVATETNPSQARAIQDAAILDETGEVAQATHGTTREDVVVDSLAPQIANESGSVDMLPFNIREYIDKLIRPDLHKYSDEEILSAQDAIIKQFESQKALQLVNHATAPKRLEDGGVEFNAVYGNVDGGWTSPQEALEEVQSKFREYDVDEDQFILMRRSGGEWVETTAEEALAKNTLREAIVKSKKALPEELKKANLLDEYTVKVKFKRDFDPNKVVHEKGSYAKNFLDRVPAFAAAKAGGTSLVRMLVDPASIFTPRVVESASSAVDRASAIEAAIVKLANTNFAEPMSKLSANKQQVIQDIIKTQNAEGRVFTKEEILATGAGQEGVKILRGWKDTWDTIWLLENRDMKTTLKKGGYQRFSDSVSGHEFIVKPMARPADSVKAFDPATSEVRALSKSEIDEIYEGGGDLGSLRSAEVVNDNAFDVVINRNTPTSFSKELTSGDLVLPYRQGYYSVRYTDPHFIMEKRVVNGVEQVRAVKTAPGVKEAERLVLKMQSNADEGVTYFRREDKNTTSRETDFDNWDLAVRSGRSSQKLRGKRLGTPDTLDDAPIEGPIETLLASSRGISRRMSMRDYLDAAKLRFMDEFGHLLEKQNGQAKYPTTIDDLMGSSSGSKYSKEIGDARTYWEYINSLEVGYRNSLDDIWRATLNSMAELIGTKSLLGEKMIRATLSELDSPTGWMRGRAFDAYLATNPLRQFIIQGHQATLLAVNFSDYVIKEQKLAKEMSAIHLAMFAEKGMDSKAIQKLTGMNLEQARALRDEYLETGLDAAIDMNNLVEKGLDDLVESQNFKNVKKLHKAITSPLRKVGFDAGERINIMSSWLAHRDRALKAKVAKGDNSPLTAREVSEVVGKARNYTFNMNKAGEMPYNKNSLSLLFQFMQVPHKMMTTILFNRGLSKGDRARLAAYNMIMLPLPAGFVYSMLGEEGLPDDPVLRETVINGVEGMLLNKLAQQIYTDDTSVSFASLTTLDATGLYDLVESIFTTDLMEIAANSPSLSLIMGNNPRVGAILENMNRVFAEPKPENFTHAAHQFASYSSGYANFSQGFKELFVNEVSIRHSRAGKVSVEDVTTAESIAKMFGLPTTQETLDYVIKRDSYQKSKAARDDVKELFKLQDRLMTTAGVTKDDPEYVGKMLSAIEDNTSAFWAVASTPELQDIYFKEVMKAIGSGDSRNDLVELVLRGSGILSKSELNKALEVAGVETRIPQDIDDWEEVE